MIVQQAKTYFRRRKTIRRLPRDLVTPFDHSSIDDDESMLLKASAAKDRHAVKRLLGHYQAASASDILPRLPVQRLTSLRTRILNWLRRLEGSSEHDPLHKEIALMGKREVFTIRHGYRETRLK